MRHNREVPARQTPSARKTSAQKPHSQKPGRFSRRGPAMRWIVNGVGLFIIGLLGLSLFVLPLRDYFQQRDAIAQKGRDFELLADATEALQNEVDRLKTPAGIRAAAREQLGYVYPGEERMAFVPMPALPTDLPDRWPYTLVTKIIEIRSTGTNSGSRALAPLAP